MIKENAIILMVITTTMQANHLRDFSKGEIDLFSQMMFDGIPAYLNCIVYPRSLR
jgi:hypothetical protein